MRGSMLARVKRGRWVSFGLLGALLMVLGGASYFVMVTPPYVDDEAAHVGYSVELADGNVPNIDTPVPLGVDAALDSRLVNRDFYYSGDVYVANNPPFVYLVSVPLVQVWDQLDAPSGPLLTLRWFNAVGGAVSVVLTFLLARELSGGDSVVGLLSAGFLASVISVSMISALGQLDGLALAAATGTMWQAARFVRLGSAQAALRLGGWCALCAAIRPMSFALAAAMAAVSLVVVIRRSQQMLVPLAVRVGGPTALCVGWFYLLNIRTLGDATGSEALFDKFQMQRRGSVLEALALPRSFVDPFSFLVREIDSREPYFFYTAYEYSGGAVGLVLALVAFGLLGLAIYRSATAPRARGLSGEWTTSPLSWLVVTVGVLTQIVLVADHWAGGGGPHPRYLLATLPVFAVALAVVLARANTSVAAAVLALAVVAYVGRLHAAGQVRLGHTFAWGEAYPTVGQPWQVLAAVVAVAGAVILLGGTARALAERRSRAGPVDGQAVP